MIQNDPQNKLTPLPNYLERHRDSIANFGLYFQKFGKYSEADRGSRLGTQQTWKIGKQEYEWSLVKNQIKQYAKKIDLTRKTLEKKHLYQQEYLAAVDELSSQTSNTMELTAVTSTRFLTGIGETTPTEVGMVFERNTGLPFIPASSIKGALRYAYCVNFARNNPDKVTGGESVEEIDVVGLVELFGSLDTQNSFRGGVSFLDAFTEQPPMMIEDIMNPHHGNYYQGKNAEGPVETEAPIPIKFLALEKGTVFKFRGFFFNENAVAYRKELMDAFVTALMEFGLGARTATGYGRFENPEETTPSIFEAIRKRKANKLEKIEHEKEKIAVAKRKEAIAAMSPEEHDLARFDDGSVTEEKVNILFKGLDDYSDEYKNKLAKKLKEYWMEKKNWTKAEVGKKQWKKVRERNAKIDEILSE